MKPNILLLFTDQQRFDTIASHGNLLIKTPVLDKLVREGTTFTRAYTPSPVCVSARCALTTGMPPHVSGCHDNMPMPQDRPSMMERLGAVGYQTHGVGKMHFTPDHERMWGFESRDISEEIHHGRDDFKKHVHENGFSHVDELQGVRSEYYYIPQPSQLPARLHNTTWTADRSIDFLKSRDRSRPFFLWSSFIKPHPPFESPTPWNKLYRAAEMPIPFRPQGYENLINYWNKAQNRYKYRDAGFDDLLLRTMKAAYYASISFIDFQIGRILQALGSEMDNTLVVFSSDHGELLGDYGSFGKRSMLDAACRIPLIARYPKMFSRGTVCEKPASLIDLFPTFLQAAESSDPKPTKEGESLAELASGKVLRPFVHSQFQDGRWGLYLTTDGEWKYTYSAPDQREWLFNVRKDPRETRNFAENPMYQSDLKRMRDAAISRFEMSGHSIAVENGAWKKYPVADFPLDGDAGLLFQDPPNHEARMSELGEYGTQNSVRGDDSYSLIARCFK